MTPAIPNLNQWVWDTPDTLVPENRAIEPREGRYLPIRAVIDDILIDLFSRVTDAQDICALERVCKKFHFLSRVHDSLWKQRFAQLWPKIVMLPSTDTSSEAQFKILHYELSRLLHVVNGLKTEKQLRNKIREIRGTNGHNGTLNQLWLKLHAATNKMDESAFFLTPNKKCIPKSLWNKHQIASTQYFYEYIFLNDCVGLEYDGTDESVKSGHLAAVLKRKKLLKETDEATTVFIKIIDLYKAKFKVFQIHLLQNFYFKIMCQNRLSKLAGIRPANQEIELIESAKDHLNGHECQLRKQIIDQWVSMFKIHQWLPMNEKTKRIAKRYLEGEESLMALFENCSCCKKAHHYYTAIGH